MVIVDESNHEQHEDGLPLLQCLDFDRPTKQHRLPLFKRLQLQLQSVTPELIAIALVYFVQGILRLSSLAITFFQKDHLHMEPAQMAIADTIAAAPWAVKPLYGFITDSFPIQGMKRRPYLILAGLTGSLSWLCLAAFARSIPTTIACITAAAAATAFSDVVADSIVVELARASPGSTEGALQSLCWGSHAFGRLITAYLSGWLVDKVGPQMVFTITATFPLVVCVSSCLINERKLRHGELQDGDMQQAQPGAAAEASAAAYDEQTGQQDSSDSYCEAAKKESLEVVLSAQVADNTLTNGYLHDKPSLSHRNTSFVHPEIGQHGHNSTAAAGNDPSCLSISRSSSSDSSVHKSHPINKWRKVFESMASSIRLFWRAVKQPHVLRPVVFLFCWRAMPGAGTAMFYFKTNKLGFDAEFFGRVKLVVALADLLGIVVYNKFLKSVRLRQLLLWGSLLGCLLDLTPLLLVEGINRKLGISDRVFALVDSALLSSISQILLMPTLVLAARLCPEGVEATLYASLMSLNNAAVGVADMLGALMMKLFGITSSNFVYLSALLVTCNVLSLVPLPLIGWVPDESTKVVESLGDYELVSAADVVNDDAEEHQHHDGEDVKAGRSEGQV